MSDIDFTELTRYAKAFSGFTPEHEALLLSQGGQIKPHLGAVTEQFYATLATIEETAPFLEGRIDSLKKTHLRWLQGLFTGPFDEDYTRVMYKVGDVHVKVKLPVEFMGGGMTLIGNELIRVSRSLYGGDPDALAAMLEAINAVLGFSLLVMQQSYQSSSLAEELQKFLAITGMSRSLFNNLASAYQSQ